MKTNYPAVLRRIAESMKRSALWQASADVLSDAASVMERYESQIERFEVRDMTLESIAKFFNARRLKKCNDWEAGPTHVFSRDAGCEFAPIAARAKVDELLSAAEKGGGS